MSEKSVYFLLLRPPRAVEHPEPTYPPGLPLYFSCDLHLIPSTRTMSGLTPWTTLGSWLGAEEGSCSTSSLDPGWTCSVASFKSVASSCSKLTVVLMFKDVSDPDLFTSLILAPGFVLFLWHPKHPQRLRERKVNMSMFWCNQVRQIQVDESQYPSLFKLWRWFHKDELQQQNYSKGYIRVCTFPLGTKNLKTSWLEQSKLV